MPKKLKTPIAREAEASIALDGQTFDMQDRLKVGNSVRNILSRKSGKIVIFISYHTFGDFADVEFEDGIAGIELKNLEKIPEESETLEEHEKNCKMCQVLNEIEAEKSDIKMKDRTEVINICISNSYKLIFTPLGDYESLDYAFETLEEAVLKLKELKEEEIESIKRHGGFHAEILKLIVVESKEVIL